MFTGGASIHRLWLKGRGGRRGPKGRSLRPEGGWSGRWVFGEGQPAPPHQLVGMRLRCQLPGRCWFWCGLKPKNGVYNKFCKPSGEAMSPFAPVDPTLPVLRTRPTIDSLSASHPDRNFWATRFGIFQSLVRIARTRCIDAASCYRWCELWPMGWQTHSRLTSPSSVQGWSMGLQKM